jgi:hypothetical protein
MPKIEIDYSNTIIYKITCKDSIVNDVYVGHTTNFVQRKHSHKQSCINDKSPNHNCKLYEVIRNNGGWNNWKMEIINFFNCQDHYEARQKEQEYFISLNATLNSIEPMPKPKIKPNEVKENKEIPIFYCEICNIQCNNSILLELHKNTKKHKKLSKQKEGETISSIDSNIKPSKNHINYICETCDFNTCNKKDLNRHNITKKHLLLTNPTVNTQKPQLYTCNCGKSYKHSSSLCAHKKKCINTEKGINNDYKNTQQITPSEQTDKELILLLLKQNNELQNKVLEICKKINL